jgi:hypothetical protein
MGIQIKSLVLEQIFYRLSILVANIAAWAARKSPIGNEWGVVRDLLSLAESLDAEAYFEYRHRNNCGK